MKPKRTPYSLPQEERERLYRSEMNAVIYFKCALAAAGYCWTDLAKRLDCIPRGRQRFKSAMGAFNAVIEDVLGTVPPESEKRLNNITRDFKIVLAPQPMSEPKKLILDMEDANTVIDKALKNCGDCYKSDDEARRTCRFYKVMETYCPLDDYGNGMICQYGKSDIE